MKKPNVLTIVLVVVLSLFALALALSPTMYWVGRPWGVFGFWGGSRTNDILVIGQVLPYLNPDAGRLKVGDRVDVASTSALDRLNLGEYREPIPGEKMTLRIIRGNKPMIMTFTAIPWVVRGFDLAVTYFVMLSSIVSISIGALVVLLRPSRMTWGFYLFALSVSFLFTTMSMFRSLSADWFLLALLVKDTIVAAGIAGFLVFACRAPADCASGWRGPLDKSAPWIFAVTALLLIVPDIRFVAFGSSTPYPNVERWTEEAVYTLGMLTLLAGYFHLKVLDRQRMIWVTTGIGLFYVANLIFNFGTNLTTLLWLRYVAGIAMMLSPFPIAYAILHYHLFDVKFIISRALVYGFLASIVVAFFALMEWFLTTRIMTLQLGLLVEMSAAIGLGFLLSNFHERVDDLVDTVFFRQRHFAEQRIAHIAAVLPHAPSKEAIDKFLVAEPADAFALGSAAVFHRAHDGSYIRGAAIGWPNNSAKELAADDELVLNLQADPSPICVHDIRWPRTDLPSDSAAPSMALPILVRRTIVTIAIYGTHLSGVDLDPDERKIIATLAIAAGAAYDHVQAEALRNEVAELRRQLATTT